VRGRVGSEAAPDNDRGRTISGQTNPTASQPPPSSADTSVRWDFLCPATWQGASAGSRAGWGPVAGPGAPLLVGVEGPTVPVGHGTKPRAPFLAARFRSLADMRGDIDGAQDVAGYS
jgi:hypothetical protein